MRQPEGQRFSDGLKKLYFDTVLYTESALKLLVEVMGPDNLLFGAECPGVGSAVNPDTGHTFDDIVPLIQKMTAINDKQKADIFENNAHARRPSRERKGHPFATITAYDAAFGRAAEAAGIDLILLVGDSLGNVVLGYASTVSAP